MLGAPQPSRPPSHAFFHVRTHKWVSGTHQKPERFFWAIAGHTDIHFPILAAVPSTGQKELCEETCLLVKKLAHRQARWRVNCMALIYLLFVCVCVSVCLSVCLCVYIPCSCMQDPLQARRGHQIPWKWILYCELPVWVLGPKLQTSAGAVSASSHSGRMALSM